MEREIHGNSGWDGDRTRHYHRIEPDRRVRHEQLEITTGGESSQTKENESHTVPASNGDTKNREAPAESTDSFGFVWEEQNLEEELSDEEEVDFLIPRAQKDDQDGAHEGETDVGHEAGGEDKDDVWIGTRKEIQEAWIRKWPKSTLDALETLIDETAKLTTASVHTKACIRLMNVRSHIKDPNLRELLLQAEGSHQQIVDFPHYGPGPKKYHVKADF